MSAGVLRKATADLHLPQELVLALLMQLKIEEDVTERYDMTLPYHCHHFSSIDLQRPHSPRYIMQNGFSSREYRYLYLEAVAASSPDRSS